MTLSPARRQFRRRLIIQRGVRAALVIILTPFTDDFHSVNEIAEPVLIQTFKAKSSVQALNKSVLRWLSRLDYAQFNTMLKGLLLQCAAGELRPLVNSYSRRIASKQCNAVQKTRDLHA